MIDLSKFNEIKNKYGKFASWAVWANEGLTPKSNVGDMSVLDPNVNKCLLTTLNTNVILIGLNFSHEVTGNKILDWHNFHNPGQSSQDYKIRFALKDTPFWGSYMTDIIKEFPEKESNNVMKYLRVNTMLEEENIIAFRQEISSLGSDSPTLVAFGNNVFTILNKHLKSEFEIIKLIHYAHYINKNEYREKTISSITKAGFIN